MKNKEHVIVVIPAYKPDNKLTRLLYEIKEQTDFRIVVIDDGSGECYTPIFERAKQYAEVIRYEENQGKGNALRAAFSYIANSIWAEEAVIVTADSDGQHQIKDIIAVTSAVKTHPHALVLGSRDFNGKVPLRSKIGNRMTSQVFKLSTDLYVRDTQTGLRAFESAHLNEMLQIEGLRYEYEMNMLMRWARERKDIYECPIKTIYINENKSSHFHPIRDSIEIYKEIIKFSCASLVSFLIDYTLYAVLLAATSGLNTQFSMRISNVIARIVSATVNYGLNRQIVFESEVAVLKTAMQYILLATLILILNTVLLGLVYRILPNQLMAKIIVELILFIMSAYIQKHIIFKKRIIKGQC